MYLKVFPAKILFYILFSCTQIIFVSIPIGTLHCIRSLGKLNFVFVKVTVFELSTYFALNVALQEPKIQLKEGNHNIILLYFTEKKLTKCCEIVSPSLKGINLFS